ncbi:MAG: carbohydrate kinase family protein [Oscillospiraceae bacterium]|jgi:2-dehydro-3-deoxygluconokinase
MIYSIGDLRADINIEAGVDSEARYCLGGTASNFAAFAAMMGCPVTLLSTAGKNATGNYLISELRKAGVNTDRIKRTDNGFFSTIIVTENGETVAQPILREPGAVYDDISSIDFSGLVIGKHDIIHTTGACIEDDMRGNRDLVEFLRKASECGAVISFDMNLRNEYMGEGSERIGTILEIAHMSRILFGSGDELGYLTGFDLEESVKDLSYTGRTVIGRNEADDVLLGINGDVTRFPVQSVKVVNPLGAGDAFDAGFIFGANRHAPPSACVRAGMFSAGYTISRKEPRKVPSEEMLEKVIDQPEA